MNHPAKFSEGFIEMFFQLLQKYLPSCRSILDPFAGTGKIGEIKKCGYKGIVIANELEPDWLKTNQFNCDYLYFFDAEFLNLPQKVDAIITSPTYGNRMADHHNAKDNSKRITYTRYLGHELKEGNTGIMQWGNKYKEKHFRIYKHLYDLLNNNGIFILNVSNHIRKGQEVLVAQWHKETLQNIGFVLLEEISVPTKRMKFGANRNNRVDNEYIFVFKKVED